MTSQIRFEGIDKEGNPFLVRECDPESAADIKRMYDRFGQPAISQGLPPADKEYRDGWIDKLLEFGYNFLAWEEGEPLGHSSIIPDFDRGDAEYIIFVIERFRNRGLGTALTETAVDKAHELGINRIWLTVENFNFRAIRLYRKVGFVFVDEGERERTMIYRT